MSGLRARLERLQGKKQLSAESEGSRASSISEADRMRSSASTVIEADRTESNESSVSMADAAGSKAPIANEADAAGSKAPIADEADAAGSKAPIANEADAAGSKAPIANEADAAGSKAPIGNEADAAGSKAPIANEADYTGRSVSNSGEAVAFISSDVVHSTEQLHISNNSALQAQLLREPSKSGASGRSENSREYRSRLLTITDVQSDEPYAEVWQTEGVKLASNDYGSFYIIEKMFSGHEAIGMHTYGEWNRVSQHMKAFHPNQASESDQFLFLDLETTGLGSGTGNVPFMVGLAFWENEALIVQQALISHPVEERAMLAYLHQLTKTFTHLVTYNGKSFDWPLLHSRYVLNGMRESIWEPLHIDLLHPSRALWRNTLESCKLSHIEKMRLGIVRVDDLPGAEAPARYFQFLADRNPKGLMDVYRHNEIDMLSLVTLATRFGHLLSNKDVRSIVQHPTEPEELVRTGLWLEKMGLNQYPEQLYKLAVHIPRQSNQTRMLLASRDKKQHNVERAVELWLQIVESSSLLIKKEQIEAAIELSMHFEHKLKQYEQALTYAELACEWSNNVISLRKKDKNSKQREQELFQKRIERLKKKCAISV